MIMLSDLVSVDEPGVVPEYALTRSLLCLKKRSKSKMIQSPCFLEV